MSLPTTGTIVGADLNTELERGKADLELDAAEGRALWFHHFLALGLDSSTDAEMFFYVDDVYEVHALKLAVAGASATSISTTLYLEAVDVNDVTDPTQLEHRSPSVSVVTTSTSQVAAGVAYGHDAGAETYTLRPGVQYRLRLASNSATASARAVAHLVAGSRRSRR